MAQIDPVNLEAATSAPTPMFGQTAPDDTSGSWASADGKSGGGWFSGVRSVPTPPPSSGQGGFVFGGGGVSNGASAPTAPGQPGSVFGSGQFGQFVFPGTAPFARPVLFQCACGVAGSTSRGEEKKGEGAATARQPEDMVVRREVLVGSAGQVHINASPGTRLVIEATLPGGCASSFLGIEHTESSGRQA